MTFFGSLVLIELVGGVALMLWGVRMVRTGILRAYGERLSGFLEQRLGRRPQAFAAGVSAAALLGSSTATALIVASFAASGAVSGATGLVMLLGADLGSALMASVLAAGTSAASVLAPASVFAGFIVFSVAKEFRSKNIGRILLGLGLLLTALKLVVEATSPLREATLFHQSLQAVASDPLLAFLIAALLAWAFHSTLAVVLLITTLLANGSLQPMLVLPLVLGLNLGGGMPAVIATLDQPAVARRLPIANLFCRGSLAVAGLIALGPLTALVAASPIPAAHMAIALHLGFNAATALVFLWPAPIIIRGLENLLPDARDESEPFPAPRYLELDTEESPEVALANATAETLRMAEMLERMLLTSLEALKSDRLEPLREIEQINTMLGTYMKSVHQYLSRISNFEVPQTEFDRAIAITLCASHIEHAGDVVKLNLTRRMKARVRAGIALPEEQLARIVELREIVLTSLRLLPAALSSGDVRASARLAAQKDRFREVEQAAVLRSMEVPPRDERSIEARALFIDVVGDLHRVNSQLASVGYPRLSAAGLLKRTRLVE